MIDPNKRDRPPAPSAEPEENGPGNSIVQAAYSAALFNDQGVPDKEKERTDDAVEAAA